MRLHQHFSICMFIFSWAALAASPPAWSQAPRGEDGAAPRRAEPGAASTTGPDRAAAPRPSGEAGDDVSGEDRPFTGDPGGEPPPPPLRPRPPDERRPAPPGEPRRPADAATPTPADGPKDLLEPPGPNLLSGQVGASGGLTRHSTGGFQLNLGWSYQMAKILWFDLVGNLGFGGACRVTDREEPSGRILDSDCGAFRGIGIDLLAGIQIKFLQTRMWKVPVVPFARLAMGAAFIITDTPNDGAALVFRVGGGARYYFSKRFSVGGELAVTLGPAWRNHLPTGFFAALALLGGVEFLL